MTGSGLVLTVLAQSTRTIPAVIITAVVFAIFHGPTDLVHWLTFTATGIAHGSARMDSSRRIHSRLVLAASPQLE